MKVQELRDLLKTADRALLEKAFTESYKQFTKSQNTTSGEHASPFRET